MIEKKNPLRKSQKWFKIHELEVLKLYKQVNEGKDKNQLIHKLAQDENFLKADISEGSIEMKFRNNQYLDTGEGRLSNASKFNRRCFDQYSRLSVEELEREIERCE